MIFSSENAPRRGTLRRAQDPAFIVLQYYTSIHEIHTGVEDVEEVDEEQSVFDCVDVTFDLGPALVPRLLPHQDPRVLDQLFQNVNVGVPFATRP